MGLETVELVNAIEEEFGVDIPDRLTQIKYHNARSLAIVRSIMALASGRCPVFASGVHSLLKESINACT